ncbi:uncharacterized protein MONBRDRAFT_25538 [Monosiga brevicollis MX1]|uniref:Uncharacterized protein n=1 Tax=Monosiga brevicollis TaxID=81824 RepID=A9UZQ1_MONBE|nr:uncharacterized protein MONBRDRAFT_25538 [Monosiga brevicollis MX1]EDQ89271.1 predicted protein [Monosiga brevicollis MX1]|eukprot:XP_001745847.1 hypothetical protein [Monosiga brevicollis MX1]
MPCGPPDETRRRSLAIDRQLRKERMSKQREYKILLLGTGESGKSTIIKQMRIIYGQGFNESDRLAYKPLVYRNIITSMKRMLDALDQLSLQLADSSLEEDAYDKLDVDVNTVDAIEPYYPLLKKLWNDNGIQQVFQRRNEYQLSDSTAYYYNRLDAVAAADYIPTVDDVLRSRQATTGIHEFEFDLDSVVFRMMDVGGQRSERRKWIHSFEGVTSIIFIAACNEYDQVLAEDTNVNRMQESLALFGQIIQYHWFANSSFILFLNKQDLLEEKVKTHPIKPFFPDYTGQEGDYENIKKFIETMYRSRKPAGKDLYTHFTMATDTSNIQFVFNAVRSTLLRIHLKDYNLF